MKHIVGRWGLVCLLTLWAAAVLYGGELSDTLPPAEVIIPGKYRKEVQLPEKQRFRPTPVEVVVEVPELSFFEWIPEYRPQVKVDTLPPLTPVLPELLPDNSDFAVEVGAGNFATLTGKAYWTAHKTRSTLLTMSANGQYTRQKAIVNRELDDVVVSVRARHMPVRGSMWLPGLTFRFKGYSYPAFDGFDKLLGIALPDSAGGATSLNSLWDISGTVDGFLSISKVQELQLKSALWYFVSENAKEAGGDLSTGFRRNLDTNRTMSFGASVSVRAWVPAMDFLVGVNPAYHHRFPNQATAIKVGAMAFFSRKSYLFPDLSTEHRLLDGRMVYFVRTTGKVAPPSLINIMHDNPYFVDTQNLKTTDMFITETGITGYPTYDIEASAIIRYERAGNFPLYHWAAQGNKVQFRYLYANRMDIISAVVGASLVLSHYLRANASFTYHHYRSYDPQVPDAYNLPQWKSAGRVDYSPLEHLHTAVEWMIYGSRILDTSGREEPLAVEINLHARMHYSKRLSFWFSIYNLLNHRHYIWYPYPAYGLWVKAGVTVSM